MGVWRWTPRTWPSLPTRTSDEWWLQPPLGKFFSNFCFSFFFILFSFFSISPNFFQSYFQFYFLFFHFFCFFLNFFQFFLLISFPIFFHFFHNFSIFPISFKCFFPQIPRFGEATEITSCSPVTPDVLVTPIPVPPPLSGGSPGVRATRWARGSSRPCGCSTSPS